jgi:hypothetical protein
MKVQSWLWPDRVISKRESRVLREEHNAAVNTNAELLLACNAALALLEDNGQQGGPKWTKDTLRKAIAKAEGK